MDTENYQNTVSELIAIFEKCHFHYLSIEIGIRGGDPISFSRSEIVINNDGQLV